MRTVDALSMAELRELVTGIQEALWLDVLPVTPRDATELAVAADGTIDWSSPLDADAWNPDLAWDADTLHAVARQLERFGLRPERAQVR